MTELSDEERSVLREAEEHEIELKRSSDRKMAEVVDRLVARTFLRIVSKDGRMPETYSITPRGVSVLRAWYAERWSDAGDVLYYAKRSFCPAGLVCGEGHD